VINLDEGFWTQRVETPLAIRAYRDEAGLAQHFEVLGHTGLAQLQALHQFSGMPLASTQQVEDLSAVRLGQGGVGAHTVILPSGDMSARSGITQPLGTRRHARLDNVSEERRHYPLTTYVLAVLCALGLASVAIGIADGWLLIAAGVASVGASLARLHVILHRRRAVVGGTALPPSRQPLPKSRR
jgi:hypothetical protein